MTTPAITSRIDPRAEIGFDVEIGPFCTIGPDVTIGQGTRLLSHVSITGEVSLGRFNTIGPFATIGHAPQDVSYQGSSTRVEIGDHNIFCQGVTIHRGSEKEEGVTRIGSHNKLMAGAHVAHDCQLGNRITMGERTVLGGHVRVEDDVEMAEGIGVTHNVTIGTHSLVSSRSKVTQDVPRYMVVEGHPARVRCVNKLRLRSCGIGEEAIEGLHEALQLLYRAKLGLPSTFENLSVRGLLSAEVLHLLAFVEAQQSGKKGRSRDGGRPAPQTPRDPLPQDYV